MSDHRQFFDYDPELKRTVWLVFDERGQLKGAHVEQEIDDILEGNAMCEIASHGQSFGDYNRVASVPLTFFEQKGLGEAIDGDDRLYLGKVLNDADFKKFRTSRGRI
jgi:hypothetical protein